MIHTYFLGAGFSRSFDEMFPVATDLLNRSVRDGNFPSGIYGDVLKSFIDNYFGDDWTGVNFEKVATFLHESPLSLNGEPAEIYSIAYIALIGVITGTLVNRAVLKSIADGSHRNYSILESFAGLIANQGAHVVTTNYDLLMDNALLATGRWAPGTGYGPLLQPIPHIAAALDAALMSGPVYKDHNIKILKLHGSLNWGVPIHAPPWMLDDCYLNLPVRNRDGVPGYLIDAVQTTRYSTDASSVQWPYHPFIVPPVFGKALESRVTRDTWFRATHRLRFSNNITIIGYSFPESDLLVERMLREAKGPGFMSDSTHFTIVNKSITAEMIARVEGILSPKNIAWVESDAMDYLRDMCAANGV